MDVLPDGVDPDMSFLSRLCGQRDFLFRGNPHTHPGRMSAYCPHRSYGWYNVSAPDLLEATDKAAVWADGFIVGAEPGPPLDDDWQEYEEGTPEYRSWLDGRAQYLETGAWPLGVPRRL